MEINKRLGNLTPAVPKTPEPMTTKFGMGDDIGDIYPCAKFHYNTIRGFVPAPARAGAYKVTRLVFLGSTGDAVHRSPLHRFSRSIRQITSFCTSICLLGVKKTKFHFSTKFYPQKIFWPIFDETNRP